MASKNFEVNDLVWAKMKGFPHWPGKVTLPPTDAKPKKNHHYIYFFGSKNYAWIADEFIEYHSESMVEKYGNRKGEFFRKAVETIIDCSKGVSKYHTPPRNVETHNESSSKAKESGGKSDKMTNGLPPSKKKSPQIGSSAQKVKNKLSIKKALQVKPLSVKKISRKRTHSSDQPGSRAASFRSDGESVPSTFTINDIYVLDAANLDKQKIVPTEKKIGFLGLNKMGQGIVKNLYDSGHSIIVWNESDEHKTFAEQLKIKTAATPADVVEDADITFCYVSDSNVAKELVERDCGVLKGMERSRDRKKGFVEMSPSIDPKISHEIATLIGMKGGCYLEAPICGSSIEADEGNLLIVAAGDKVLYDDCKSCFDAISKKHMFVSPEVGTASKMNVVHNMFIGTVYASLAESLSLVDQVGLRGKDFFDILQVGALNSNSVLLKLRSMIGKNYAKDETGVTLNQMQQDFSLGLSLGHDISQHTKLFAQANELYKRCKSKKYGDYDVSAVYEGTKP